MNVGDVEQRGLFDSSIILRGQACEVQLDANLLDAAEQGAIPFFSPGQAHIVRGARYFECEFWKADPDALRDLARPRHFQSTTYL